ncbi:hypothetical protein AB205_0087880, partial [Aquarana catesbeiana]
SLPRDQPCPITADHDHTPPSNPAQDHQGSRPGPPGWPSTLDHQLPINAQAAANQCPLTMPTTANATRDAYQCRVSMPPITAHQCRLSVPPIRTHLCSLSVPSVAYQCPPVPPMSAQCRLSMPISAAYQCRISVPI